MSTYVLVGRNYGEKRWWNEAGIVALVGEYKEFTAYSDVLADVDRELSEKWCLLWKWNIGLVVMSIINNLGYLYRTAKIFREYPAET